MGGQGYEANTFSGGSAGGQGGDGGQGGQGGYVSFNAEKVFVNGPVLSRGGDGGLGGMGGTGGQYFTDYESINRDGGDGGKGGRGGMGGLASAVDIAGWNGVAVSGTLSSRGGDGGQGGQGGNAGYAPFEGSTATGGAGGDGGQYGDGSYVNVRTYWRVPISIVGGEVTAVSGKGGLGGAGGYDNYDNQAGSGVSHPSDGAGGQVYLSGYGVIVTAYIDTEAALSREATLQADKVFIDSGAWFNVDLSAAENTPVSSTGICMPGRQTVGPPVLRRVAALVSALTYSTEATAISISSSSGPTHIPPHRSPSRATPISAGPTYG